MSVYKYGDPVTFDGVTYLILETNKRGGKEVAIIEDVRDAEQRNGGNRFITVPVEKLTKVTDTTVIEKMKYRTRKAMW